jgi:hypothetical protein
MPRDESRLLAVMFANGMDQLLLTKSLKRISLIHATNQMDEIQRYANYDSFAEG